ncbi:hypothetical protein BD289DRAFT_100059 [Coniella lustricola]|uniref:Secreted protein n=1 Tax=Coniella lustricola TaxID=2025994 RepID=A0A2T3AN66_9PEZI|nr:hypothetical protein BD289DRAFT_100059 [Coniella lustricola]
MFWLLFIGPSFLFITRAEKTWPRYKTRTSGDRILFILRSCMCVACAAWLRNRPNVLAIPFTAVTLLLFTPARTHTELHSICSPFLGMHMYVRTLLRGMFPAPPQTVMFQHVLGRIVQIYTR